MTATVIETCFCLRNNTIQYSQVSLVTNIYAPATDERFVRISADEVVTGEVDGARLEPGGETARSALRGQPDLPGR
ncbi:MAG: hypothetical protein WBA44_09520 [Mesorhizobium sp.]